MHMRIAVEKRKNLLCEACVTSVWIWEVTAPIKGVHRTFFLCDKCLGELRIIAKEQGYEVYEKVPIDGFPPEELPIKSNYLRRALHLDDEEYLRTSTKEKFSPKVRQALYYAATPETKLLRTILKGKT